MAFDLRTRVATCDSCGARFILRERTPVPGMICHPACLGCGTALRDGDDDLVEFIVVRRLAQPADSDQT